MSHEALTCLPFCHLRCGHRPFYTGFNGIYGKSSNSIHRHHLCVSAMCAPPDDLRNHAKECPNILPSNRLLTQTPQSIYIPHSAVFVIWRPEPGNPVNVFIGTRILLFCFIECWLSFVSLHSPKTTLFLVRRGRLRRKCCNDKHTRRPWAVAS